MILHLAAAVGVRLIVESPVRTIETNVHGTQTVLDAACKRSKLVFIASTSEVYGKSDNVPFHEDADLVLGADDYRPLELRCFQGPRRIPGSFLLEGKETARRGRAAFQHSRAAPDGPLRHGAAEFRRQALDGDPITVYGTGQQSRCFCDVRDASRQCFA